ncbi:outer membrane biosynthesis protein TonB [Desulfitispora alkaliphila]|uniref:rRNA biogenesis protein rrp5 n=1 Tax=Desulfitispora alkaliphila TaxID=622674 RepID=UPI003D2117BA
MSKIKLALEVVSDLKALADSIETLVHAMESNGPNLEDEDPVKETKKKSKPKAKEPEAEAPIEEVAEEKAVEEKEPTLEEVRAAMADKSRDGHREAVKAIITKYGANNLSSLDPKHYRAALKEVGEIK